MTAEASLPSSLALLGTGNLGEALVRGLLRARPAFAGAIRCTARRPERAAALARYGIAVTDTARAVADAELAIIAVRHSQLRALAVELAPLVRDRAVVSLVVGAPLATLAQLLPGARVQRAVTNVAVERRAGTTLLAAAPEANAVERARASALFALVGAVEAVDERLLDAGNALVGAGPAFVYRFAAALASAGESVGLPPPLARALTVRTLEGAAAMLADGDDAESLIARLVAPGGSTEAGLQALAGGFGQSVAAAVEAAVERARARDAEAADWIDDD